MSWLVRSPGGFSRICCIYSYAAELQEAEEAFASLSLGIGVYWIRILDLVIV